ncbi:ATP-grasp peptide maturase system methyltransferase [Streptomyces sp. NPDC002454]
MTPDATELRRALTEEIAAADPELPVEWRESIASVPRELFLGTAVFRGVQEGWQPVNRKELGEEEWLRMVYSDRTWVTQVDGRDADGSPGPVTGSPTSSATLPSLVVRTALVAGLRGGEKVLEVGTGTGYSTALLCHRFGAGNAENIVSIEYDQRLAANAAVHLHEAGYAPVLVVGDGLQGCRQHADYDAVVATCSVRSLPPSWFWQLNEGGSITTTISGWMLAAGLIRLTLDEEGTAHGRFTDDRISYMLARPHERPPAPVFFPQLGNTRTARVDPRLLDRWAGRFVAQLAAPSAQLMTTGDGIVLRDVGTGSQAWTEAEGEGWIVHQHGPLSLWDQVEAALLSWQEAGAPDLTAFGMTATPEQQNVWLGSPDGPKWSLPV